MFKHDDRMSSFGFCPAFLKLKIFLTAAADAAAVGCEPGHQDPANPAKDSDVKEQGGKFPPKSQDSPTLKRVGGTPLQQVMSNCVLGDVVLVVMTHNGS